MCVYVCVHVRACVQMLAVHLVPVSAQLQFAFFFL